MEEKKETSFMTNYYHHQPCPLCRSKENNLSDESGFVGSLYDQKVTFVAEKMMGNEQNMILMGNAVVACTCRGVPWPGPPGPWGPGIKFH